MMIDTGQEAFVDEIVHALGFSHPNMKLPRKELVYNVLEKLTKDRKVYQTSEGYFVVSPDTFKYMIATDPVFHQQAHDSFLSNVRNNPCERVSISCGQSGKLNL